MKKLNQQSRHMAGQRQQGAILVFCLIFLTVLTMMGVSGMESTTLEERMSANMVDHERSFNAAETALQAAEAWLVTQDVLPITSTDGSTTVWVEDSMDPTPSGDPSDDGMYWWDHANMTAAWWTANGDAPGTVPLVSTQPRYLIEEFKTVDSGESISQGSGEQPISRTFHRITARGWGVANTTSSTVQATFVQRYN
ncbi:MAG: PilX N-terminal domain-containing pilus assembly protein [Gammaproteobacteria bacterium]